jgi:CRISPR-associated protein Cas1
MHTLYVLEPGTYIRKDGETLRLIKDGVTIDTIPATGLGQLALAGRVSLSGAVLDFLISNRIDTVFMTLGGRFRARLLLDESGHVALRQQQYIRLADQDYALKTARAIVEKKLENQARLLLRRAAQRGTDELRRVGVQLKALPERLARTADLDEIRGVEGYGSRLFYSAFGLLIRNEAFSFKGRNRRPPRDPVNGMLSFVYMLFTNEVLNGLKSCGLDPYLGALHAVLSGRPSLACDLVEEWRVFAERLVLTLINRKAIRPEDFIYRNKEQAVGGLLPVEMKPAAAKALIASYHAQLAAKLHYPPTGRQTSLRWIIHSQCREFGAALAEGKTYQPFVMPR